MVLWISFIKCHCFHPKDNRIHHIRLTGLLSDQITTAMPFKRLLASNVFPGKVVPSPEHWHQCEIKSGSGLWMNYSIGTRSMEGMEHKHYAHCCIHTPTSAHVHPQTMDRLKTLLTQEGINFTDTTFKTEDGIERLGEQPFVSVYLSVSIQFPFQNCFIVRMHYRNTKHRISAFTNLIHSQEVGHPYSSGFLLWIVQWKQWTCNPMESEGFFFFFGWILWHLNVSV